MGFHLTCTCIIIFGTISLLLNGNVLILTIEKKILVSILVKKYKSKTPAQDRLQRFVDKIKTTLFESSKKLADVEMIASESKNQRKSIGIPKAHEPVVEPSFIDIVDKTRITNGCTIDAATTAYIIPDTNVFMNSLACIKNVIDGG